MKEGEGVEYGGKVRGVWRWEGELWRGVTRKRLGRLVSKRGYRENGGEGCVQGGGGDGRDRGRVEKGMRGKMRRSERQRSGGAGAVAAVAD